MVRGAGVYGQLRYESGVHRVQRVPATEAQGRIHTSAATVAVLPEAEEVDVAIADKDLRIDKFRSSGPGGQSVNTTDSAERITHIPTGLVVSCQDQKSQLQNKLRAMEVMRARLFDRMVAEQEAERAQSRRAMVGTGDRSAKIRTYNYPQNRLNYHRIHLTLYFLTDVVDAIVTLTRTPKAQGRVFNLGSEEEVTILELAERVKAKANPAAEITTMPYEKAYVAGFEDIHRRVPDLSRDDGVLTQSDEILLKHLLHGFQSPGSPMAMPAQGGNDDQECLGAHRAGSERGAAVRRDPGRAR